MSNLPSCPQCGSEYTYEDRGMYVCPMCAREWSDTVEEVEIYVVRDANGNVLEDGDSVTIIKDLKVKGASQSIKQGTKVKSIRLVDPIDGHDIDCKIEGFGQIGLKSEFVKKL